MARQYSDILLSNLQLKYTEKEFPENTFVRMAGLVLIREGGQL